MEAFAISQRIEKHAQLAKLPHGRRLEISNSVNYLLVTAPRFILEDKVLVRAETATFGRAALTLASLKGPFMNDWAAKLWYISV